MGQDEELKEEDGSPINFDLTLASPMMKKSNKYRSKSTIVKDTSPQYLPRSHSKIHRRRKSNIETSSMSTFLPDLVNFILPLEGVK